MRVFLGLSAPELDTKQLNTLCRERSQLRPHRPVDRHMTLGFIGECSLSQVEALTDEIDLLMTRVGLAEVFWHASSINMFPEQKPKAWALTGPITDSLKALLDRLSHMPCIGQYINAAGFLPHVSLAYANGHVMGKVVFNGNYCFDELVLYRSLSQVNTESMIEMPPWAKPRYEKLKVWKLQRETGLP